MAPAKWAVTFYDVAFSLSTPLSDITDKRVYGLHQTLLVLTDDRSGDNQNNTVQRRALMHLCKLTVIEPRVGSILLRCAMDTDESTDPMFWYLQCFLHCMHDLALVIYGQYFWLRAIWNASASNINSARNFFRRIFLLLMLSNDGHQKRPYYDIFAPSIKRHIGDVVFSTEFFIRNAGFCLFDNGNDLRFIESLFHVHLPHWLMNITKLTMD